MQPHDQAATTTRRSTAKPSAKQPKETRRDPHRGQAEYSSFDTDDYKHQPPRKRRAKASH